MSVVMPVVMMGAILADMSDGDSEIEEAALTVYSTVGELVVLLVDQLGVDKVDAKAAMTVSQLVVSMVAKRVRL